MSKRALFILGLVCLAVNTRLSAQASLPLFEGVSTSGKTPDSGKQVNRSRYVTVDFSQLARAVADRINSNIPATDTARKLTLNLFTDVTIDAVMDKVERSNDGKTDVWIGHIPGKPFGTVFLSINDQVMAGNVKTGTGEFYQIRYAGAAQIHAINDVDETKFPGERQPLAPNVPAATADEPAAIDTGDSIDVMVVYTPSARAAAGGTAAMQTLIQLGITESNQGYANSQIVQRINLVYSQEVAYTEASSGDVFGAALDAITTGSLNATVLPLRDQYRADLVSLWINNTQYCGLAWLMTNVSSSFESRGYSVVHYDCATGYYSFGHEMGHNEGAHHDRANASGSGAYSYSYGYQQLSASPKFRTVMAYDCSGGCTRVNYWSNPAVSTSISGPAYPTGVISTSATSADNHLTLNNTRTTVANFRQALAASIIQSPVPGTTLSGSTVAFTWTAGTGVTGRELWIGTTVGGRNVTYAPGLGSVTSYTATLVGFTPGANLYVRLWSFVGSTWVSNDYTYTAPSGGTAISTMITPTPGTTLSSTTVTFTWTAGIGVSGHELWIGTTAGARNVTYAPALGAVTSYNAILLGTTPGATVYVRLWSLIGSTWSSNDYTYTAPSGMAAISTMITPTPGTTLSSTNVTFTWTAGSGVSGHELWIGTTAGARNVTYAPALGAVTSYNAILLGTTPGATLYVRLWSLIGSTWASNDYTYTAPSGTAAISTMITPTPGTTLPGTSVTFTWTAGTGVSGHELWIGTTAGGRNVTYAPGLGTATSYNASLLGTTSGGTVYVRLWSLIGSAWASNDYTYTAR